MDANESTLRERWKVLRKRRSIVFLVFLCIFGLVAFVTFASTPIYQGTVRIIIERVMPDNLSGGTRYPARDPEFDETQFQLIRSHSVASRVVNILDLEKKYEMQMSPAEPTVMAWLGELVTTWKKSLAKIFVQEEKSEGENAGRVDIIARDLTRHVSVRPVQNSDLTAISFKSPNPDFAALAANTYVKAYLQETLEMKMDATRRNLEWMTQKAETERLKLQATEKRLQDYVESENLVTLENKVTILPEKLSQLGRDLVRAETKTKEYKLLYDKVRKVSGDLDAAETVLSISEGASLDILRAEILRAEQNIMELSSKYGTKHPVMLKAKGDLDVLREKRRNEIGRITQKVRDQYELALSNERSIRAQLNQTKAEALELNRKYAEYSTLKGEIETNRQLYDALLTKIKDQSITGETRPVNIWVVETAKAPRTPVSPNRTLNLALGLVLGLACGVAAAFLLDHLDNRVKSSEDAAEALDIPVLGSVAYNRNAENMSQIVSTQPRSEYAESFNGLRTMLMLASAESPPRRILVTSSIAGEGKTTTAVNLALTMAKNEERVLLIDADLRKPRIHKIFKMSNNTGLSNYLTGTAGKSILKKGPVEGMVVIPAGPVPPNPYELLNSKRMVSLLDNLSSDFDCIICDTAPTLNVADSRLMSKLFDGLLLVARAGVTTYPMAQDCIKSLKDVHAHVLGLLVNAVQVVDREDYYRYYSSYLQEADKPEVPDTKATALRPLASQESTQA